MSKYLHTQNPPIIFRDLKPSNIMRTMDGHLYLIDFGIARFFKPGQRKDTANQGSLGYASPEQYGKTQTTPSSDIYSLGVILYQILTGYDITATAFHFPPLQSLAPAVPLPLAMLIARMTDFDEKKRPHSVNVVRQELDRIANGNTFPSRLPISEKQTNSSLPLAYRKPKSWLFVSFLISGIALLLLALYAFVWNSTPSTANTLHSTPFTTNTPSGVLNTFCKAMNSSAPDFQAAYSQLSRKYQSEHSFISFQEYFRGTIQCIVASSPNEKNQAGLHLTMSCQPDNPPPNDSPPSNNPPPKGTPPDNPPPGNPPPKGNPADLTLVNDGNNGWKIDAIYVVGYDCGSPQNGTPSPRH